MIKFWNFIKRVFLFGFPYLLNLLEFKQLTREEIEKLETILRKQRKSLSSKNNNQETKKE